MKKLFAVLFIAASFIACNNSTEPSTSVKADSASAADSIAAANDSIAKSMARAADSISKKEAEPDDNLVEPIKKKK